MIKTMWILTFREDLDPAEVSTWWRTSHGELALKVPGIKRYVQNHYVPIAEGVEGAAGGLDFQGVVECWFDDEAGFDNAMESPEWAALEADGYAGLEMTKLQGGAVREHVMRWDALPDGRVYTASGDIPAMAPTSSSRARERVRQSRRCGSSDSATMSITKTSAATGAPRMVRSRCGFPGSGATSRTTSPPRSIPSALEGGLGFQGVVECWFDDEAAFETAITSPEWAELRADEPPVFQSELFQGSFVREYVMRWENFPDGPTLTTSIDR